MALGVLVASAFVKVLLVYTYATEWEGSFLHSWHWRLDGQAVFLRIQIFLPLNYPHRCRSQLVSLIHLFVVSVLDLPAIALPSQTSSHPQHSTVILSATHHPLRRTFGDHHAASVCLPHHCETGPDWSTRLRHDWALGLHGVPCTCPCPLT